MKTIYRNAILILLAGLFAVSCKETSVNPANPNGGSGKAILYSKIIYDENNEIKNFQAWRYDLETNEKKMLYDSAGFVCKPVNGYILLWKVISESNATLYLAKVDGTIVSTIGTGKDYGGYRYILTPDLQTVIMTKHEITSDFPYQYAEVYTFDINGGNRKLIFTQAAHETTPVLSPDGTKIAIIKQNYSTTQETGDSLFVLNIDGSGVQFVMDGIESTGMIESFDWSPIGNSLICKKWDDKKSFVMTSDFGLTKIILTMPYDCWNQFYSPYGNYLAFSIYDKQLQYSGFGISTSIGDGFRVVVQIPYENERAFVWPTWSPDGNYILVFQYNSGEPDPSSGIMKIYDIDTGRATERVLDSMVYRGYWVE